MTIKRQLSRPSPGFFGDRNALHTLTVAGAACVLSLGLVYVGYFLHVLRIAHKAPCDSMRSDYLLMFGKHAPGGRMDPDFDARLQRGAAHHARVTLLGSRYHLARCTLFARQRGIGRRRLRRRARTALAAGDPVADRRRG